MKRFALIAIMCLGLGGCLTVEQACSYLPKAEAGWNLFGTIVNIGPEAQYTEERIEEFLRKGCAPPRKTPRLAKPIRPVVLK